jgi:hypothetical protein
MPAARRQKITLAEMRASGVRGLLVYCSDYHCSHSTAISGDRWPDDVRLSDLEPRFTCQACGRHGADVRPDWQSVEAYRFCSKKVWTDSSATVLPASSSSFPELMRNNLMSLMPSPFVGRSVKTASTPNSEPPECRSAETAPIVPDDRRIGSK